MRSTLSANTVTIHTYRHPFYGSRKIKIYLRDLGHKINRKRVQRLMVMLGLAGMAPGPNTCCLHPQHKIYPYLLRGVNVTCPNQVWSTDITYVRLPRDFVYLVAVIDWYSRKVLLLGLTEYFTFYNTERTHQSLDYSTRMRSTGQRAAAEQASWTNTAPEKELIRNIRQKQNWGSAIPLHVKSYPLNLDALLS